MMMMMMMINDDDDDDDQAIAVSTANVKIKRSVRSCNHTKCARIYSIINVQSK